MSPSLSVVSAADLKQTDAKPQSVSERVRQLQAEAKQLAGEHTRELLDLMIQLEQCAVSIADGGEAYAPGIRNLARQIAEDMESKSQTLEAIQARVK